MMANTRTRKDHGRQIAEGHAADLIAALTAAVDDYLQGQLKRLNLIELELRQENIETAMTGINTVVSDVYEARKDLVASAVHDAAVARVRKLYPVDPRVWERVVDDCSGGLSHWAKIALACDEEIVAWV